MSRFTLVFSVFSLALAAQGCNGPGICVHGPNWKFKTGLDAQAHLVSFAPKETTIDALRAFPHVDRPEDGSRIAPVELQTWIVRDVELAGYQRAPDGDVHMEIEDEHGHTMIIEATPPFCTSESSPWRDQIASVRKIVDAEIPNAVIGWRHRTMSVAGVGYLDFLHGQFGVADNGVELHPVLAICFGKGCTLPDVGEPR